MSTAGLDPLDSPELWAERLQGVVAAFPDVTIHGLPGWTLVPADEFADVMENPLSEVRELAMTHLREFAGAGDPFSLAILEGREIP